MALRGYMPRAPVLAQDMNTWTIMHHLAYSDNHQLVESILKSDKKFVRTKQSSKNYFFWLTRGDRCRYMPIHVAAQFGSFKSFKLLWDMQLPENNRHLGAISWGKDKKDLMDMLSPENKTKDGQFSFFFLFFSFFFVNSIFDLLFLCVRAQGFVGSCNNRG